MCETMKVLFSSWSFHGVDTVARGILASLNGLSEDSLAQLRAGKGIGSGPSMVLDSNGRGFYVYLKMDVIGTRG